MTWSFYDYKIPVCLYNCYGCETVWLYDYMALRLYIVWLYGCKTVWLHECMNFYCKPYDRMIICLYIPLTAAVWIDNWKCKCSDSVFVSCKDLARLGYSSKTWVASLYLRLLILASLQYLFLHKGIIWSNRGSTWRKWCSKLFPR